MAWEGAWPGRGGVAWEGGGATEPLSVSSLSPDCGFPLDLERAKRDHGFLDKDALDSLCR